MSLIKKQNLRSVDTRLKHFRGLIAEGQPRPPSGWIRTLREALGMSTEQLAARMKITRQTLGRIEESERRQRISLATLQRVADALDADLLYAIVPRKSIQETLEARARTVAGARLGRVARSMQLEKQEVSAAEHQQQIEDYARMLMDKPRELWK